MLAREKNTQKIDPIHLCFGDSGRLFTNTENRPDQSTSRLVRDTSAPWSPTNRARPRICHLKPQKGHQLLWGRWPNNLSDKE